VSDYPYDAKNRITALIESLQVITQKDPEQEVRGMALPVLDAVIAEVKNVLPRDAIVNVEDVISPEAIERGEPVRALDALIVAQQIDAAIGPYPPLGADSLIGRVSNA
jgi:hypothetical protein